MIKDAESHADEAHRLRELADTRNQAEQLAYQTERTLKEHRDKLDEADRLDDRGPDHGAQGRPRVERRQRDPLEDDGARGGVAQARRGDVRAGDRAAGAAAGGNGATTDDDEVVEEAEYEVIDEEEAKTS